MASRFFSTLRRAQAVQVYVFDVSKGIAKCTSFRELEALLFTLDKRSIAQPAVLTTAIVFKGLAGGKLVHEIPRNLIEQFARELPQLRPTVLVSCLFSVAQLGQTNVGELLTRVELELLSANQTREFTPSQLVQLLWSFGRLNPIGSRQVMDHLVQRLITSSIEGKDWYKALSVQELVHLMWALNEVNLHAQFPEITKELLGKRGGWRAIVNTNALADLTVSVVDSGSLGDKDLASLQREWVHNRKLGDVDTLRLFKLIMCLAKVSPASLAVFPSAAQEFTNRHFIGMRFEEMSALVCEYSRIGQMDYIGMFDKVSKEMIKPKHWKPCRNAALPMALARLPQTVRDQPNVALLVDKLSLEQIKPESQLLAAWAFACLGKPILKKYTLTERDGVTSPSEFTTVDHQVQDGFWVDAYIANDKVVVEMMARNYASDANTLLGQAEFRQRLLKQRGYRVLFLCPTFTKNKYQAQVDKLIHAIVTGRDM
ncbi:hypothetical protein BASA81_016522 [Batrachochytrium salamandrivorans]|nr:hypothetical protein BASA81_016522 [Batrachochytrium salamandrivorans]